MTKDELRIQRSIDSITKKINASLSRTFPKALEQEREFERECIAKGLIYSPSKLLSDFI